MTTGIYILRFRNTDKVYIGQSIDIEERLKSHVLAAKGGRSSRKLNEAYAAYGEPSVEVLIECNEEELDFNENLAIEIFNSVDNGFNTLYTAESMPKWKNTLKGEDNGASTYSNGAIYEAAVMMTDPQLSLPAIATVTGINEYTLRKISEGVQHNWISEVNQELWDRIQLVRPDRVINNHIKRATILSDKFSAKAQGIIYPEVKSPNGTVYKIENLSKFCREHDLQAPNLRKVLYRKRNSHKGWTIA